MQNNRKVILFIAVSTDGYIATVDEDLSFLSIVEEKGEDYGYGAFIKNIDTVIIGRKTYDKVLSMGFDYPHGDKESFIITRSPRPDKDNIKFYTGNLAELITALKSKPGKNIFVDGGSEIVTILMKEKLIDEFIISVIPVFLGSGIRLFKDERPEQKLTLLHSSSFKKGLVQLHYSVHSAAKG